MHHLNDRIPDMKRWQFWLGLAISAIFLFFAFRGLNLQETLAAIRSAEMIWIIPAIPVYFTGLWLRAYRWKIFLRPILTTRTRKLFPIIAIGYMGNNIYPARLGEVLRAVILKQDENIPVSASLATIIIERIFDGIVMLGFILLNISAINLMTHSNEIRETVDSVAAWGSGIFLAAFIVFLISAFFPGKTMMILIKIVDKMLPGKISVAVSEVIRKFFSGIQSLSSPTQTANAMLITIIIWLLETGFYWIIMQAFPFNVGFGTLMLLNGFLNLFTIIPSSPGYIGTFDAPAIALLTALGIEANISAGYTLLLHAALWLPVTLFGAYFFIKEGMSWDATIDQAKGKKDQ